MKNNIVALVVIVLVLIGVLAFASKKNTSVDVNNYNQGTVNNNIVATTSTTTLPSVSSFTVSSQNFSFAPSTLTVKKGDRVKVTLNNISGTHDLNIDEFDVTTGTLEGPGSTTVEFVADKVGSFEYYCSIGNHRAMGMKGILTVTE